MDFKYSGWDFALDIALITLATVVISSIISKYIL